MYGKVYQLNTADHAKLTYYRRSGTSARGNDPLIFIHGVASNMTRWTEFVEQSYLTNTHDVLLFNLRGHGRSPYRGRIGLEIWCDDIAAILHQEGHQRAILIGHCLGANIAVMFAVRYPQLARGIVLVEPMLKQALIESLRRLSILKMPVKLIIGMIHIFNRLGIFRRRLKDIDLYELDKFIRTRIGEPGGSDTLMRRYASPRQDIKIMPSANYLQDLLEVMRPLPLDKLRVPFLALLSNGSTYVDPDITTALLSKLPQGEVHTLDAKHWIPTEQPMEMRRIIEAWVTALEKG